MTSFADWLDRGSTAAGGLVRVVRDGQIAIVTCPTLTRVTGRRG